MKVYHRPVDLILTLPIGKASMSSTKKTLENAGIALADLNLSESALKPKTSAKAKGKTKALDRSTVYVNTKIQDTDINPWDLAHLSREALGDRAGFVEPDRLQEFVVQRKLSPGSPENSAKSFGSGKEDDSYDPDWEPHKNIVWHLDDEHSELLAARSQFAGNTFDVRIMHIDTGYSADHPAIPDKIRKNKLQRNFVDGEPRYSACDPMSGGFGNMPGHGTGTLGILAGGQIKLKTDNGVFDDYLGGAYFAEVVCCRISKTVVLMKTSAFAEALRYAVDLTLSGTPIHVISMSMGGAPTQSWADAVNEAYAAGITLVTAAGNNINGLPTRHVVYPARFQRVIAACGATYDNKAYKHSKLGEMQGCFGPLRHMQKALAAYTPNTAWASAESGTIRFSGAGTSSATPQIAAAAALYYKKNGAVLDRFQGWMRVEAVRHALFSSAFKPNGQIDESFGNGILRANKALDVPALADHRETPADKVPWFPILDTIFGVKAKPTAKASMLNVELGQLVFDYPELSKLLGDEESEYSDISRSKFEVFTEAVISHSGASETLKRALKKG